VQDPGFFTSVSSNGISNAVVWAVRRPINSNPARVVLYAFDPQAAASGDNRWLFSAAVGTWPNTQGNANIVPVVANGRVYVASYKQLSILALSPPSGAKSEIAAPFAPVKPPELPPDGHQVFGTIKAIAGQSITLATRTGKPVLVDATDAARGHHSVVLLVGSPVAVLGSYDRSGVLHATSVLHAKPSPQGWPADR
jgi:hypothetical protein